MRLKATEHDHQKALFDWLRLNKIPAFAIPNASHLPPRTMGYLKAEGLEPGVPDLFIPVMGKIVCDEWSHYGLFIEMKSETGTVSPEQKEWHIQLEKEGYQVSVCRSSDEAIEVVKKYLGMK